MTELGRKEVRVRAAPSPTGRVHTGNLRTFLWNYLWAKHTNGKYVLRIEDTDQERKVEGGIEAIIETLKLYGINFDEGPGIGGDYGPYIQSQRLNIYKRYAEKLIEEDKAYYCFCSKERLEKLRQEQQKAGLPTKYDGHCRHISKEEAKQRVLNGEQHVIRMKFPQEGVTEFRDEVYGRIRIENKTIDDQILLKADGYPTYHFAVVIDDHFMKITDVLRGREYLSQTPKNIFLYQAFGWEIPKFVHVPLILNPDGKGKLSKRKGAQSALSYLRQGYLPEAVLNFLALLGWAPKQSLANKDDIYSLDELIELFSIDRIRKANPRYDQRKLDYINGKHIRSLDLDALTDRIFYWAENYVLKDFIADQYDEPENWMVKLRDDVKKYLPLWKANRDYFKKSLTLVYERMTRFDELPFLLNFFYDEHLTWIDADWKLKNHSKKEVADVLEEMQDRLEKVFGEDGDASHDNWEKTVRNYADKIDWKHGEVFMSIRSAVTGRLQSPPLYECIQIMGWNRVKRFLSEAIAWLRTT